MDTKFNIGSIKLNTPAGGELPEMEFELTGVEIEVKGLSISEFGGMIKSLIVEGRSIAKEYAADQADQMNARHEKERAHLKEMRQMEHQHEKDMSRIRRERLVPQSEADTDLAAQFPVPVGISK